MTQIFSYRPAQRQAVHNAIKQPIFQSYPEVDSLHKDTFQKRSSKPIHFAGGLDDVVGLADIKQTLMEQFVAPVRKVRDPNYVKKNNIKTRAANGLLLYGPPGNGKSYIAKKVAEELENLAYVAEITPEDRANPRVGMTEKKLTEKFQEAAMHDNSIVLIHEFDSLAPRIQPGSSDDGMFHTNRRAAMLLLLEDAAEKGIIVIGTSNKSPEQLDDAVVRKGRFDVRLEVPMPDEEARKGLFRLHIQNQLEQGSPFPILEEHLNVLAQATEGSSAADIVEIVQSAARKADYQEDNLDIHYIVAAMTPAQHEYLRQQAADQQRQRAADQQRQQAAEQQRQQAAALLITTTAAVGCSVQ